MTEPALLWTYMRWIADFRAYQQADYYESKAAAEAARDREFRDWDEPSPVYAVPRPW